MLLENVMNLFGFELKRREPSKDELPSFVPKESDDGAMVVAAGGSYGTYVDLDGAVRTEAELVTKYREMALHPECDAAVDEIVNESMSVDEDEIVSINLDKLNLSENIKRAIRAEFSECLRLLDFNNQAYDIYKRWYVDGRLYFHVVIDPKESAAGIQELRYIDPRKIRKVREVVRKRAVTGNPSDVDINKTVNEYFIFNDRGFGASNRIGSVQTGTGIQSSGLKIAKDSILHVVSGITDSNGTLVLSYLHKAIKSLNQLRTLEDATVIYRISRAPERRVWYVDVGNLPKPKAEQYVRDLMVKNKNRLVYDATTGDVRDDRKFMAMLEDYWLPRREGGKGTELTTLPGGQNLGQMEDVLYFQKKFLNCLNVPVSRLNSDALYTIGRATEITRDELKFAKFIVRLRARFSELFLMILEKQLVLKGILLLEDWERIAPYVKFDYARDNYFTELKDGEILMNRIEMARNVQDMVGKYYSHDFVRRDILKQSEDQIEEQDELIIDEMESEDPRWLNPAIEANLNMMMANEHPPVDASGLEPGTNVAGDDGTNSARAELDDQTRRKLATIRQALINVRNTKKKSKEDRTDQEQSKYKRDVQILAKNPELLKQIGLPPSAAVN
jgi:hypothetical protein